MTSWVVSRERKAMSQSSELFDSTFDALERSLTVALIAEWDLILCTDEETARKAFKDREDISQLPFRDGDRIVGVWLRSDGYRPLDETMLISEATPIREFIAISGTFRLVLKRGKICGIVTRSDLNKLPVRLLSFGVITHLEIQMACLITRRYPSNSWLDFLDGKRRRTIERRFERDEAGPDWEGRTTLLGCTDLMDKFKVLEGEPDIGADLNRDRNELNLLRRKLAHSDDYVWDMPYETVENFCQRYQVAQNWVVRLHGLLEDEGGSEVRRAASGDGR
jgi:hypothetical protein